MNLKKLAKILDSFNLELGNENIVKENGLIYYKDVDAFNSRPKELCYISDSMMHNVDGYNKDEIVKYRLGYSRETIENALNASIEIPDEIFNDVCDDLFNKLKGFDVDSYIDILDISVYFEKNVK